MDKDISFAITTLKAMIGKHFSKISFSYFGNEPLEESEKIGFLNSVEDIDKTIILGFGINNTQLPSAKRPHFKDINGIISLQTYDSLVYHTIDYSSDLIVPFLDVLENGIMTYLVNKTSNSSTGYVISRDIRRTFYRCDEIQMVNDQPRMSRKQVLREYF